MLGMWGKIVFLGLIVTMIVNALIIRIFYIKFLKYRNDVYLRHIAGKPLLLTASTNSLDFRYSYCMC